MPSPSSRTTIRSRPPAASDTSTWRAPASRAFSTHSLPTGARRATTSPPAVCPCTSGGRTATLPTRLENEARVLARDPGLDFLAGRLEARAAHEPGGEPLALLDARLTERVDAGERAGRDRRGLEQVEELADRERVQGRDDEGRARTSPLRERQLGRPLLGVQQLGQRMAAEVRDALEVLVC